MGVPNDPNTFCGDGCAVRTAAVLVVVGAVESQDKSQSKTIAAPAVTPMGQVGLEYNASDVLANESADPPTIDADADSCKCATWVEKTWSTE